jgi:hypothetical protein
MVTFLCTHCPTICPLIGAELAALTELGKEAKKVDVVALSVDPVGDTRSTVQAWLKVHQEPDNFHHLIGSEAELKPYWEAWHLGPQIQGDPDSSHTAAIYHDHPRGDDRRDRFRQESGAELRSRPRLQDADRDVSGWSETEARKLVGDGCLCLPETLVRGHDLLRADPGGRRLGLALGAAPRRRRGSAGRFGADGRLARRRLTSRMAGHRR